MAFNHCTWGGGAHFVRGGFPRHLAISHGGFGQPIRRRFAFRRGFAFGKASIPGGLWPYYGFDYVPTDTLGDIDAMTYGTPEAIGALPAPACHRSEEMVTVPSEGGGTRQIKIIRCPSAPHGSQPWVTRTDATSCLAITINVRFRAAKGNLQPAHANRVAQQSFNVCW